MKIVLEFNSFEEMVDFARELLKEKAAATPAAAPVIQEAVPDPVAVLEPEADPGQEDEEPAEVFTTADVRAYLAGLRKAGKKAEVTGLLKEMGYDKFTDIPEDRYPELMQKARSL